MRARDGTIVCVKCDGSFVADEQGGIHAVQQASAPQAPAQAPAVNRTPAAATPTSGFVPQQLSASQRSTASHATTPVPVAAPAPAPVAAVDTYGLPADAFARYASSVGSSRMGGKLLTGWAMLGEVCDSPYCSCPIMRSPGGELVCVNCPQWLPQEQRQPGYSASVDVPPPTASERAEALHRYGEDNTSYTDDADSSSGMLESKFEDSPARVAAFADEAPAQAPAGDEEDWAAAVESIALGIAADEASGPAARETVVPASGITETAPAPAAAPAAAPTAGASAPAGQRLSGVAVLDAPADWSSMTHEELMAFAAGGSARPAPSAAPKPAKPAQQQPAPVPKASPAPVVPPTRIAYSPAAVAPVAKAAMPVVAAAPPAATAAPVQKPTAEQPSVEQAPQLVQAAAALQASIGQASAKLLALSAADSPQAVAALAASIQACAAALAALKQV